MYTGIRYHLNLARMAALRLRLDSSPGITIGALKWEQLPDPELPPNAGWVAVHPLLSGVCGSDLGLLRGRSSPYLAALTSFPAVLGHEVVGEVVASTGHGLSGTRVVVDPTVACSARGLPPCRACATGRMDGCEERSGSEAGMLLGYHHWWPGGWSTRMWVPEGQLHPVPEGMSLFRAVLAEPTSIVLTGLTRVNWQGARTVLVIGAGTIGLLSLWALASLYPSLQCHVLARYPNQASLASQLGASSVWEDIGQLQPAGLLGVVKKGRFGAADYGSWGFDVVVDAVGSTASIRQSLLLTRPGGQVLMLGGAGQSQQDLAPFWVRNLTWHGTFGYQHGGHSHFPEALALLNETSLPVETIVTDMVPLEEFSSGLARIFRDRGSVIKMVWKIPDNKDTL